MVDIIRVLQFIIYSTTFFYALYEIKLKKNVDMPSYMSGFYWYPAVGTFVGIIWILCNTHILSQNFFDISNTISLIFHFSFLSYFIFKIINNVKLNKKLIWLFWIFQTSITFSVLIDFKNHSGISYNISNLGLFIFSIIYYYNLIKNITSDNILNDPSFWIITGILFGLCLNLPIIFFGNYLFKISKPLYISISWIAPFGYIVMYMFFLKGIKCSTHQPKQS